MEKDILLVGQDRLELYQDICADPKIKFRVVSDLPSCINAVKEKFPNLTIVDYEVAGKEGIRICETLKKYPETQRLPVLFVVPKGEREALLEALYIPVDDYIFSPLDPEDFKNRFFSLLGLQSMKDTRKLASVKEKVEELETTLELFPDYNAGRQELAEIYEKTDVKKALQTLLKLAEMYYNQKNFGLAMDVITRMKRMFAEKSNEFMVDEQFQEAVGRCSKILEENHGVVSTKSSSFPM